MQFKQTNAEKEKRFYTKTFLNAFLTNTSQVKKTVSIRKEFKLDCIEFKLN